MDIPMRSAAFLSITDWVAKLKEESKNQSRWMETDAAPILNSLIEVLEVMDDIESIPYHLITQINTLSKEKCLSMVECLRQPDARQSGLREICLPYYQSWAYLRRATNAFTYLKEAY